MRAISIPLVALALLAALGTAPLTAQPGGAGIIVFEDVDFGGRTVTFFRDTPDLRPSGFDKRISSFQIARGDSWEVCEGVNYTGQCQIFSGQEANLVPLGWNDRIASLRRVRGGYGSGGGTATGGLELYSGRNFSGQRKVVTGPVADLKDIDFNDRAVSVRVPRNQSWEVCVNADYNDCRLLDRDYPDLGEIGVRNLVSSVRPSSGRGWGRYQQGGGRVQVVLYERAGFAGNSVTIDQATASLGSFINRAQSVEVFGGRWELCDQLDFQGNCSLVTRSVTDLDTLGLRGRVVSVRPR